MKPLRARRARRHGKGRRGARAGAWRRHDPVIRAAGRVAGSQLDPAVLVAHAAAGPRGPPARAESDLWESQHDPGARPTGMAHAVQIVARLLIGIPDDLAWMFEQGQVANGSRRRIAVVVGVGSVLGLWLVIASRTSRCRHCPTL